MYEPEEDEESNNNFSSFINNQTIEVVIDSSVDITKAPFFGYDPDQNTLFLKGLAK